MDRNMITVMTGQVVDFFDRDFRELYAISEKLDLYKEFHVSPPAPTKTETLRCRAGSKRPPLPATTSRFQVTLGDSKKADIQVPAHKYHNPKYLLAMGELPRPSGSLHEFRPNRGSTLLGGPEETAEGRPRLASSEKLERLSPVPAETPSEVFEGPNGVKPEKKGWPWRKKLSSAKSPSKLSVNSRAGSTCPSPTETNRTDENEDNFEVVVKTPPKWKSKKSSKLSKRTESEQTVNTTLDNKSKSELKF